ncbi:VOC family protein [Rhizobium sp. S152]|uniref:VOC family protein n=1 Tax=Rhizobium sp. S152 TaxID=3055038 RepID=UPI0025A9AF50|nr:VOC family protein [Rhizobium sp. S152]MDM9628439.1 VOC family protein [Rhizobium sp. S152]
MQQQISAITLGISDMARSRKFYSDGFGWTPIFENEEIIFYQMNGFVLGTFKRSSLEDDMTRMAGTGAAAVSVSHNVSSSDEVVPLMDRLIAAGGRMIRKADAPVHGGFRGYVADPDGHAWEIAFNPSWAISDQGYVTFGV